MRLWVLLLLTSLTLLGCAEGSTKSKDDTSVPDQSSDLGDTTVDVPTDVPGDTPTDETGGDLTICTPGMKQCAGSTTLQTCNPTGTAWTGMMCGAGMMCQDDVCMAEPMMVCTPNEVTCSAFDTRGVCSPMGTTLIPTSCAPGRCVGGNCTTGKTTGEACTTHQECAGQSCQCAMGQCPTSTISTGYCTTSDCDVNGCATDEVCVNFGMGARTQPNDCVLDCTACTRMGFACQEYPEGTGMDVVWKPACYVADDPDPVGAPCTADEQCIGGMCITTSPNGATIDSGYCSAPCELQANCPSNAACIRVADFNNDAGFCALSCENTTGAWECPAERPSTFDIDCIARASADGGPPEQVCFQL